MMVYDLFVGAIRVVIRKRIQIFSIPRMCVVYGIMSLATGGCHAEMRCGHECQELFYEEKYIRYRVSGVQWSRR